MMRPVTFPEIPVRAVEEGVWGQKGAEKPPPHRDPEGQVPGWGAVEVSQAVVLSFWGAEQGGDRP